MKSVLNAIFNLLANAIYIYRHTHTHTHTHTYTKQIFEIKISRQIEYDVIVSNNIDF
jgi:hypothetical protein